MNSNNYTIEDYYRAAIGPNADFYLNKFKNVEEKNFSIVQFLFLDVWLAYRKMYTHLLLYFILVSIIIPILSIIGAAMLTMIGWDVISRNYPNAIYINVVISLIGILSPLLRMVCYWFYMRRAPKFYKRYIDKKIQKIIKSSTNSNEHLKKLRSIGGVNVFLCICVIIINIIIFFIYLLLSISNAPVNNIGQFP